MFNVMRRLRRARSPLETAIELEPDDDGHVREQIVNELVQSLHRLSNNKYSSGIAAESIVEDQWNHLRNMEEMHVVKSIEGLASIYDELWQRAESGSPFVHNVDNGIVTSESIGHNRIPRNLNNWRKRVRMELEENAALLERLYARKAKLGREREKANEMIQMIEEIFDENRQPQSTTNGSSKP